MLEKDEKLLLEELLVESGIDYVISKMAEVFVVHIQFWFSETFWDLRCSFENNINYNDVKSETNSPLLREEREMTVVFPDRSKSLPNL